MEEQHSMSIECPVCGFKMSEGKKPFVLDDVFVDFYSVWQCNNCGHYFFKETERDIRLRDAKVLGIIPDNEPNEELVYESKPIPAIKLAVTRKPIISVYPHREQSGHDWTDNYSESTTIVN